MESSPDSEASLPGSILAGDPWFLEGFKVGRRAVQREVGYSLSVSLVYIGVAAGCYTDQSRGRLGNQRGIWQFALRSQPGNAGSIVQFLL